MGVRFFSTPHFRLYRRFPPSLPPSLLLAKEPAAGTGPEQKGGEGRGASGMGMGVRRDVWMTIFPSCSSSYYSTVTVYAALSTVRTYGFCPLSHCVRAWLRDPERESNSKKSAGEPAAAAVATAAAAAARRHPAAVERERLSPCLLFLLRILLLLPLLAGADHATEEEAKEEEEEEEGRGVLLPLLQSLVALKQGE